MTAAAIVTEIPDPRSPLARFELIADDNSVTPLPTAGDGSTQAAQVRLNGVPSVVFATDPRRQGGAMSSADCDVIMTAYRHAVLRQQPIIGIWQSGGARLDEGVLSLDGVGKVFAAMTTASGQIPQLSLVLGAAAGGAAYGPALTDVVVLAPDARLFVTGPDVVRRVTGEDLNAESLGGPAVHERSGVAHVTPPTEAAAFETIRDLAVLFGEQGQAAPATPQDDPGALLPERVRRAYDVRPILRLLLDADAPQIELQPRWAPNIVTTLGRLGGRSVGVVANQPLRLGGCLDSSAADKAARFVRLCDALGLPVITVVDVPGYLPGGRQETEGVVRRGAKLLHAYAGASVPLITLVTRKAFGGAYIAMASRSLGATSVLAWPGAEIGVMGPEAAVEVLHRRDLEAAGPRRAELTAQFAASYRERAVGIDSAIANGLVDEVVQPHETRAALAAALVERDNGARGRWGNIPL